MKKDGFAAVLVVIIVLAVAVIGGIVYVNYVYLPQMAAQKNNIAQSTSTASTSTLAVPPAANGNHAAPLDTSNWQMYQNSYYSFKYPMGWIADNPKQDNFSVSLFASDPNASGTFPDIISIDSPPFIPQPQFHSIQEAVAFIHERGDAIMVQPKEYHIQNGDAFYWTYPAGGMNEEHGVHAFLASDNSVYHMGYLAETLPNASLKDQQNIIVSILSTFKFLP
jgi:hypothetical protein